MIHNSGLRANIQKAGSLAISVLSFSFNQGPREKSFDQRPSKKSVSTYDQRRRTSINYMICRNCWYVLLFESLFQIPDQLFPVPYLMWDVKDHCTRLFLIQFDYQWCIIRDRNEKDMDLHDWVLFSIPDIHDPDTLGSPATFWKLICWSGSKSFKECVQFQSWAMSILQEKYPKINWQVTIPIHIQFTDTFFADFKHLETLRPALPTLGNVATGNVWLPLPSMVTQN